MAKQKEKGIVIDDANNYWNKLAIWRKFATYNKMPTKCDDCPRTNAHKTVLLEDGRHICWYSWIKKGSVYGPVVAKKASMVDLVKEKKDSTKKAKVEKKLTSSEEKLLKDEIKKVDSVIKTSPKKEKLTELDSGVVIENDLSKSIKEATKSATKKTTTTKAKPAKKKVEVKKAEPKKVEAKKEPVKKEESKKEKVKKVKTEKPAKPSKPVKTEKPKKEKAVKTESKIPQEIRRIPDYTSRYNPYITKFDVANSKNKTITW
ncbi:MAG: hypothetical protein ACRC4M_03965, partial [Mycoplasma sp.]